MVRDADNVRMRSRARVHREALELEALERRLLLDSPSPDIQGMVDQISEQSYTDYLTSVTDFPDRNSYTQDFLLAEQYIVGELEGMGLDVEVQTFQLPSAVPIAWNENQYWAPASNIIATIPGTVTPEQEYLLSAHYDSVAVRPEDYPNPYDMIVALLSPSTPAPGVDDNGSGSAALLEAARVMSQYQFESTVKFVFFGAEEQGLVGSDFYTRYAYYEDPDAEEPVPAPDDIRGAINLDMIAYWDGDPAEGETLDVVAYTGDTFGIDTYPNIMWLIEDVAPDLTPAQIEYVMASLIASIPPPPVESVDSSQLASAFVDAAADYNTGLQINLIEASGSEEWWLTGASDHFNFLWYGWPSMLLIEDLVYGIDPVTGYPYSTVTSPYYHSAEDNLANINATGMATAATRTAAATIGELAGLRVGFVDGDMVPDTFELLYDTEGSVGLVEVAPGDYAAELTETSPAVLSQQVVMPSDADRLTFDARFVAPGDGDALVVEFNANELLRMVGTDLGTVTIWMSPRLPVSPARPPSDWTASALPTPNTRSTT